MSSVKRVGLGGLSAEQKAKLKKIILEKVREEMHKEAIEKQAAKDRYINAEIIPLLTDGLDKDELQELCRNIQKQIVLAEKEKVELEFKLHQQHIEMNEMSMVIQLKGKFPKPVLRKVNKDNKLEKIHKKHQEKQAEAQALLSAV